MFRTTISETTINLKILTTVSKKNTSRGWNFTIIIVMNSIVNTAIRLVINPFGLKIKLIISKHCKKANKFCGSTERLPYSI